VLTALVVSLAWSSAADAVPKAKASDLDGIETAYAQYRTRTVRAAPALSPGCLSQLEPKALRPRCSSHALCSALPVPLPACAGYALRLLRPRLWLLQPSALLRRLWLAESPQALVRRPLWWHLDRCRVLRFLAVPRSKAAWIRTARQRGRIGC
jgi:hypothetical protein